MQELGWDSDVDDDVRVMIEDAVDSELIEEAMEAVDLVLLWWRDDDGDLVEGLMDSLTDLTHAGYIWLMTPKVGRNGLRRCRRYRRGCGHRGAGADDERVHLGGLGRHQTRPAQGHAPVTPAVGEPAPDFVDSQSAWRAGGLADLRGDRAVIVFYPWAFSGICRGELAALRDDHDRFRDLEVRVVAISCDAMFTLRAYADAERIGFDLLSDHWPHGAIAKAYGVFDDQAGCALRGTFVLDAAGMISWQQVNGIGEGRDFGGLLSLLSDSGPKLKPRS